ncbi:MAG TPA: hypothetical protein VFD01_01640, partial [Candidatus Dormibacteraeota bacterium]|nr:hypothetical protein [Candidatus Dormibacteraeota bacterium]
MTDGVGEQPGRGLQALVVSGLLGQVGEEVAEPMPREAPPAALGIEPEQDLGQGQADQLGIGEARRPGPRRTPSRMKRSSMATYRALMRVSSWDCTYLFS